MKHIPILLIFASVSCGPPDPYQSQPSSPGAWCTSEPGFVLREGACVPVAEGARAPGQRDAGAGP